MNVVSVTNIKVSLIIVNSNRDKRKIGKAKTYLEPNQHPEWIQILHPRSEFQIINHIFMGKFYIFMYT